MSAPNLPKKVAVLMGGPSAERDVSLATGRGISDALKSAGIEVEDVDVRDENFILSKDVDVAFIALHGTFGEDGQVQRILESRGVPFTGEGVAESETAFDKIRSKEKFREAGVPTPQWEVVEAYRHPKLALPYVVKPPKQGSTVGVYIVRTEDEAQGAVVGAARYDSRLLVEQFVAGRELTIGVLGDQVLPILEIIPKGGFYDYKNKYPFLNPQAGGGAEHVCPAKIDSIQTGEIQELALRAHRALGLKVYSRVDIMLPDDGEPTVLEINTIPGMTPASLLPEAAAAAGISYVDLCLRIIELSLARQKNK